MKCNCKRWAACVVAVFAFVFLFEWVLHGNLLKTIYESTPELWRGHDEHQMWAYILGTAVYALAICCIFTKNFEGKGIGEGLRFGLMMGVLVGSIQIATFCYMPISLTRMLAWVGAEVVKGLGAGVLLSLIYKN